MKPLYRIRGFHCTGIFAGGWMLLLAGCVHRNTEIDAAWASLERIDAAWHEDVPRLPDLMPENLAQSDVLTDQIAQIDALDGKIPSRELGWRRARAGVALGLLTDDVWERRRLWASARADAAECALGYGNDPLPLLRTNTWPSRVQDRLPCVVWLAYTWRLWEHTWIHTSTQLDDEALKNLSGLWERSTAPKSLNAVLGALEALDQ